MNFPQDDQTNDNPADNPTMDQAPAEPAGPNQIVVDLTSLGMPDEQDQMTPPAVGDVVQANIEGKVDQIVGDKAYVTMTAVNGNLVEEASQQPGDDQEMANLQGMAAQMPEKY